jgi:hypothetical protein
MSEVNLLVFGCIVTSIGVAGAHVYIRDSFTGGEEPPRESEVRDAEPVKHEVPDLA